MFVKLASLTILAFAAASSFLAAEMDYQIQETGTFHVHDSYQIQEIVTFHTHESHPIDLNEKGQILGWYNIDGTTEEKHYFVRDKDGSLHELPSREKEGGNEITWRFLKDDGKVYGTFDGHADYAILYLWDQQNDVVKIGDLPGKEISVINDEGQVLIKSIKESVNGNIYIRPAIWQNGVVTKLKGVEGDFGIESEESYGLDMNNRGEVVGSSVALVSSKNGMFKQMHAVKWINGQAIDLHGTVPKIAITRASAINDLGDVLVGDYLIRANGEKQYNRMYVDAKATNKNYFYTGAAIIDQSGKGIYLGYALKTKYYNDLDSMWLYLKKNIAMNDNGEIVAEGVTIFGETHAILITPLESNQ